VIGKVQKLRNDQKKNKSERSTLLVAADCTNGMAATIRYRLHQRNGCYHPVQIAPTEWLLPSGTESFFPLHLCDSLKANKSRKLDKEQSVLQSKVCQNTTIYCLIYKCGDQFRLTKSSSGHFETHYYRYIK
jgi:hypothetical protein